MADNFYDNDEFRELLSSFEKTERTGKGRFFDPDDLLDIAADAVMQGFSFQYQFPGIFREDNLYD